MMGCQRSAPISPSSHSLAFGGDIFLGRGLNVALFDDKARDDIFGDVAPIMRRADLALVNGEGVIARGGYLFNKGEPRPFMFRAHPKAVGVLKGAGVDVVNVANNHACDYGSGALLEMLHRLRKAGIDTTGGGAHIGEARAASFHTLDGTVVAIVGADFTRQGACGAQSQRPGILTYPPEAEERIVSDLSVILKRSRRYAHLVFLTPHWGLNGATAPTAEIRRLARRLIGLGFDGILGHSAHRFQGVELIGGKPVIYDAGNLLDDLGGSRAFLWTVNFTAVGVTGLEGRPLELSPHRTQLARKEAGARALETLRKRSEALGTKIVVKGGTARVLCTAKRPVEAKPRAPARPVPVKIQEAPNDFVRERLPRDVTRTEVAYANGITLVGYKLFTDGLFVPKAAQVVELFFKTDRPLSGDLRVHLEAVKRDGKGRDVDRHIPGDWLMPVNTWPVGKIITDRKLFRLVLRPEGAVDFTMALFHKTFLVPIRSKLPLEGPRVHLGTAAYSKSAPRIYHAVQRVMAERAKRTSGGRP